MIEWLSTAKAILPHVGSVLSAAIPAFTTQRSENAAAAQASLLQQQILELQAAATQNAAHIRELAAQIQGTVSALEKGAAAMEAGIAQARLMAGGALVLAAAALAAALLQ